MLLAQLEPLGPQSLKEEQGNGKDVPESLKFCVDIYQQTEIS